MAAIDGFRGALIPPSDPGYDEVVGPFYSAAIERYAPRAKKGPHAHELPDIVVVLAGSFIEDVGAVRVEARAGSTLLTPRAVVHANQFGSNGAALLAIKLNRDQELVADPVLAEWRWGRGLDVYREALRLATALRHRAAAMPVPDLKLDDLVFDLIAAAATSMNAFTPRPAAAWLDQVRCFLDEASASVTSVIELARSAGVHPVYLARRFRQAYGCSVAHYRRRARLLAAVPAIAAADRTLSRVAAESGFADHSHLTRECRATLRVTPSAIRSLVAQ